MPALRCCWRQLTDEHEGASVNAFMASLHPRASFPCADTAIPEGRRTRTLYNLREAANPP